MSGGLVAGDEEEHELRARLEPGERGTWADVRPAAEREVVLRVGTVEAEVVGIVEVVGVAAAIGLVITGNLVVAAMIDRFGWFGVAPIPLDWPRVVGILLLAGGAALVLRK